MGTVKHITDDRQYALEMTSAGTKLVVVDFFAEWCGPCRQIAPKFEQFASKYPLAAFLKVDVDKCQTTAASNGVTAMPTFLFFRNGVTLDSIRGADPAALEEKIKKHYGGGEGDEDDSGVKGHMNLFGYIHEAATECLNESDDHTLKHCLSLKNGYLESDCDEQLIISLVFSQTLKLHSLKIEAPLANGPKVIKVFSNLPQTPDFDSAESMEPLQTLTLTNEDLAGSPILLKYVKLQSVNNLTLFVKNNQNNMETTRIDNLVLIGSPVNTTNMSDFKRIAGKKGESH